MEEKLGQSTAVLFKYEKLILAEEETTSAGGCGVSLAAFSCPASACPSDRVSRGFFIVYLWRDVLWAIWGTASENGGSKVIKTAPKELKEKYQQVFA